MSKNRILKRLTADQTFTVPGGVKQIRATVYRQLKFLQLASAGGYGDGSFAGIGAQGDLWVWGSNTDGALGLGDVVTRSLPVLHPTRRKWKQIVGGFSSPFYLALDEYGDAYAWGRNNKGQLGDNTTVAKSVPTLIPGGRKWRQLSAGANASAGITLDGDLYTWGENINGEIGDGTVIPKSTPTRILAGTKFKQVQCFSSYTIALKADGTALSWGNNTFGGLGAGATMSRSTPGAVLGSRVYKRLVGPGYSAYAIDDQDRALAWGEGGSGQLGNNSIANQSSPVLVSGNRKWQALASVSANAGAIGIDQAGDLYFWGDEQLNGNNASVSYSTPFLLTGGRKYKNVGGSGNGISYAVSSDGMLWGWGSDDAGSYLLANGASLVTSTPVLIGGGLQFKALDVEFKADQVIDVTPGQALALKLSEGPVQLGANTLSDPVDYPLVVLEYFA